MDAKKMVYIRNAVIKEANSPSELMDLFNSGNLERHTGTFCDSILFKMVFLNGFESFNANHFSILCFPVGYSFLFLSVVAEQVRPR